MRTLDEIKATADAARPGPWFVDVDLYETSEEGGTIQVDLLDKPIDLLAHFDTGITPVAGVGDTAEAKAKHDAPWKAARESQEFKDATFCAHARTDVPLLVEELRKADRDRARTAPLEEFWRAYEHLKFKAHPSDVASFAKAERDFAATLIALREMPAPFAVYHRDDQCPAEQARAKLNNALIEMEADRNRLAQQLSNVCDERDRAIRKLKEIERRQSETFPPDKRYDNNQIDLVKRDRDALRTERTWIQGCVKMALNEQPTAKDLVLG